MTLEEYTAAIQSMIDDPSKAGETGASVLESLKADDAQRATLEAQAKEQQKTITQLNSKLFMSQTGTATKTEDESEKTPREIFNELFDARFYPEEK